MENNLFFTKDMVQLISFKLWKNKLHFTLNSKWNTINLISLTNKSIKFFKKLKNMVTIKWILSKEKHPNKINKKIFYSI